MCGVEARERTGSVTIGIPAVGIDPDMAAMRATPIQVPHRSPHERVHDNRPDPPASRARLAHPLFCLSNGGPFGHVRSPQLQQVFRTPAISAERGADPAIYSVADCRPNGSCSRGKVFRFGSLLTCRASLAALKRACCPQPRHGGNGSPRMTVTSCAGTWFRSWVTR